MSIDQVEELKSQVQQILNNQKEFRTFVDNRLTSQDHEINKLTTNMNGLAVKISTMEDNSKSTDFYVRNLMKVDDEKQYIARYESDKRAEKEKEAKALREKWLPILQTIFFGLGGIVGVPLLLSWLGAFFSSIFHH